jgi:hypothetical protein
VNELITRAFIADLQADGDGRTVVGQCVPYNTPTLVADGGEPYMEVWSRGVFKGATKDPGRVLFNFMHQTSLREHLGRAVSLVESDDGLEGVFRVVDHPDGDKALGLVRDGTHRGLSIHAAVVRSRTRPDGVIERQAARLLHVALVDQPAYTDAQVSAIRHQTVSGALIAEVRARQADYRLRFVTDTR